jgi:hypothetical protein
MHQAIKGREAATSHAKPLASFETSFTCLNGKGAKGQKGKRAKGIKHLLTSI